MTEDIWITEVEIENFQSHKHTVLPLVKGTNALVGSSNSGKSAVLRAIKWATLNIPSGTDFIRVGEETARVKLKLSNGKDIERIKSRKKDNFYKLYENGELIEEYTGFGQGVPPDITEAHGIIPIAGDTYFQFAHQLEAPFMLSMKPKNRAEIIGNLEELEKIDQGLSSINDDLRLKGKEKKELEKTEKSQLLSFEKLKMETDRLSEKIETLKILKDGIEKKLSLQKYIDGQLIRLKEILNISVDIQIQVDKANRIVSQYPEDLEGKISFYKKIQAHIIRLIQIKEELQGIQFMKGETLAELDGMKESIELKTKHYESLTRGIQSLKNNQASIDHTQNSFNERVLSLDYSKLDMEIGKYKVLFNHVDQLRKIDKNVEETDALVKKATNRIDELLNEFIAALHEEELCPTCGQDTHEVCTKTLETII